MGICFHLNCLAFEHEMSGKTKQSETPWPLLHVNEKWRIFCLLQERTFHNHFPRTLWSKKLNGSQGKLGRNTNKNGKEFICWCQNGNFIDYYCRKGDALRATQQASCQQLPWPTWAHPFKKILFSPIWVTLFISYHRVLESPIFTHNLHTNTPTQRNRTKLVQPL